MVSKSIVVKCFNCVSIIHKMISYSCMFLLFTALLGIDTKIDLN